MTVRGPKRGSSKASQDIRRADPSPLLTARAVGRKTTALARQLPRMGALAAAELGCVDSRPAVVVDSFPKSGTHLLRQIAVALPGTVDYGRFVATVPPVRHTPRRYSSLRRRLSRLAPGEVVRTHLWYDARLADLLASQGALHLFVYRDPRDVVVSEAHYLTEMAPWHSLHGAFKARLDLNSRIMLSIAGLASRERVWYPDIARRFDAYAGWLADPTVLAVCFEDLLADREGAGMRIGAAYGRCAGRRIDEEPLRKRLAAVVDPKRSHTYRAGRSGAWRNVFTDEHRDAMKRVAGDLLVRLGYETDLDW